VTRYPKLIIAAVVLINIAALLSFSGYPWIPVFSIFSDDDPKVVAYHELKKYAVGEAITFMVQGGERLLGQISPEEVFNFQQAVVELDDIFRAQSFLPVHMETSGQPVSVTHGLIR
jgi:hypothetical protein